MVVYAGARPLKRDYRRFKMKSVTAHPDDYASMEEVLTRRLQRYADGDEKFAPLPDGFLIDGGMTHAAVAEKVCAAFGLHIPIFGMVKDDRHRTRALTTAEGHEIDLHADPAVFALIGQIQEETHRFAITYQMCIRDRYYLPRGVLPREILLPFAVDGLSGLETVLTSRAGHRVTLRVPQRGEKAELLAMAERNAREEMCIRDSKRTGR